MLRSILGLLDFNTSFTFQLEPQRFLQIIHFPIRTMRIVTDPVVDSVAFLIKKFALPPLLRVFHFTGGVVMYLVLHTITMVAGRAQADKASEGLTSLVCHQFT